MTKKEQGVESKEMMSETGRIIAQAGTAPFGFIPRRSFCPVQSTNSQGNVM
ncbi:MAG: hypothetical protein LBB78_07025 [Spirochaetaceae bacterium]|jgi:hypothetical protein|nr:hypothetical protein [Spirochaetaceae bacterium]